ncbi:MAG: hypothetical protein SWZ49_15590 [Cyanobacteriota bacterium]|nr:hypothetical protein [Cyanobacteriota bacterium]
MLKNSYVVWEGASLIDGSPIVLILTGFVNHTLNRKTGKLIQSWVIQQNFVPTEAAKKGLEKGICGSCPLKLSQTGACFVNILPVNNIYRKYFAGNYPKFSANEIEVIKRYRYPIRIGSYGDPTAVPFDVWEPIISASGGHTGYTHRWDSNECDSRWKKYLMASVQSESKARIAQNLGWRTFRIITPDAPLSENEILCRHTKDNATQCEACMLCDGKSNKPNIADRVHGLKWKVSNFVKYSNSLSD